MPEGQTGVDIGAGIEQYNPTVQHVSNGDPANQTVFRAPSIVLENRTDALKDFVEAEETLRDAQLGSSSTAMGGVQGTFNTQHSHAGGGESFNLDFSAIYERSGDQASFTLETAGGTFEIKDSASNTLLKVHDVTHSTYPSEVHISGAGLGDASVHNNALDYGTDPNQINLDEIPDGSNTLKLTNTQKAVYDDHLTADASTEHSLKLQARTVQLNDVTVLDGNSTLDVTAFMPPGVAAGGDSGTEGVVTDFPWNLVVIRTVDELKDIDDGSGNRVYGRITESAGTWTLTLYSDGGTPAEHSVTGDTDVAWFIQQTFNLSNIPTLNDGIALLCK